MIEELIKMFTHPIVTFLIGFIIGAKVFSWLGEGKGYDKKCQEELIEKDGGVK